MSTVAHGITILSATKWSEMETNYQAKMKPWVQAFVKRRERRLTHPVHDFLFEYYQCKRRLISEWHPPLGVLLEGAGARKFLKHEDYSENDSGVFLDPLKITERVVSRVTWIRRLIEAARARLNQTNCYGLHEWAMIYKSERIRHQTTPLRLPVEEIERVIESSTIRCTHYDAFRFFSHPAKPLNKVQPTHEDRRANEQFGCVHFNMDLFKWCYKLYPWISSELTLDCFFLAVEARELDMRASPYDLSNLGYKAIPIETAKGRKAYQNEQERIAEQGRELAARLLDECRGITNSSATT